MTIVIIVIVLVVIVVGGALIARQTSQRRQFGPEYDQLANEVGPRQAQAEFAKRQKRVDGLDLKQLSPEQRAAYEARWEAAQEQFIDNPRQATQTAAGLVTAVAAEVGYPVDDREQLLADLSVNHGKYLEGYRRRDPHHGPGRGRVDRGVPAGPARLPRPVQRPDRRADGGRRRSRLPRRDQAALEQSS